VHGIGAAPGRIGGIEVQVVHGAERGDGEIPGGYEAGGFEETLRQPIGRRLPVSAG